MKMGVKGQDYIQLNKPFVPKERTVPTSVLSFR